MAPYGQDDNVFIVAELSANHNQNKNIALDTIRAAKEVGADAVKFQTYTADTITLNSKKEDFIIKNGTIWDGRTLYDLYREAYTPWEWHADLYEEARKCDLVPFSTPFDFAAVDLLESLDTPIYKVASFEISDIPLIEYIARKGKPIVISTGIASLEDIELAVETCRINGNNNITLLKCTSSYPAPIEEADLLMIPDLKERFDVKSGLSDHTLGITAPVVAATLGASFIEKHFILDKSIGGPDSSFSLDKKEFAEMVRAVREAKKSLGKVDYKLSNKTIRTKEYERSLYVSKTVRRGEILSPENIRSVRPGYGLHPSRYHEILGRVFSSDLEEGTALKEEHFD